MTDANLRNELSNGAVSWYRFSKPFKFIL